MRITNPLLCIKWCISKYNAVISNSFLFLYRNEKKVYPSLHLRIRINRLYTCFTHIDYCVHLVTGIQCNLTWRSCNASVEVCGELLYYAERHPTLNPAILDILLSHLGRQIIKLCPCYFNRLTFFCPKIWLQASVYNGHYLVMASHDSIVERIIKKRIISVLFYSILSILKSFQDRYFFWWKNKVLKFFCIFFFIISL